MGVIVVALLFGVLGIVVGWKVGSTLGEGAADDRQYWLRNLAVVVGGVLLSALISALGLVTVSALGFGLIGGGIAGLKMGYGKSVGVWRKHDEYFRVNRDQVSAADSARRAREAGMTEEEMASRDMVSVAGPRRSDDGAPKGGRPGKGR